MMWMEIAQFPGEKNVGITEHKSILALLALMRITCQRQGRMIRKMLIQSVVRAELEQGMVRSGQFTQQESKLVFEIADIDGNGKEFC